MTSDNALRVVADSAEAALVAAKEAGRLATATPHRFDFRSDVATLHDAAVDLLAAYNTTKEAITALKEWRDR